MSRRGEESATNLAGFLIMAAGVAAAGLAEARPIALKRRHSDNVYAAPYTVGVDARSAALVINDDGHSDVHAIESVQDRKGDRQVTAAGKLLDSHITVILSGRRQIWYADAFTDRIFAIDYCE